MSNFAVFISSLATLSGFGLIAWLLFKERAHLEKDRDYWRTQYDKERENREHVFNQLLLKTGHRMPDQPLRPEPKPHTERPVLSEEERAYCENVIAEAATLNIITHTAGTGLLNEMAAGRLNKKSLDELVGKWRQTQTFQGSVADI